LDISDKLFSMLLQIPDQLMEYVILSNKTRAKPFQWTYIGNLL